MTAEGANGRTPRGAAPPRWGGSSAGSPLQRRLGEQLDLRRVARDREADHLVRARLLEARDVALEGLGVGSRRGGNLVRGLLPEPGVVVADLLAGLLLRTLAEAEVEERDLVRAALPPLLAPELLELLRGLGQGVGRRAALGPPVAVFGGAPEGDLRVAADQESGPSATRGRRADLVLLPEVGELLEHAVEGLVSLAEVDAGDAVVVLASAGSEP